MGRETTYAGKVGGLTRFTKALASNAAEVPHLEGARIRLESMLGEVQETASQQAALVASKQEASKKLKTTIIEAERLANGLRKLVTEHYGLRSEKLAEFGLQPFRGRKVKATTPETPEPPATPTAPFNPNL
jgi:hypothetical protein